MQMLNRYFTPFALVLILSAVYFRIDDFREAGSHAPFIAAGILVADVLVNWWLGRNQYRWIKWSRQLKLVQVWLPFVLAPTAAGLTASRGQTLVCALVSIGTMVGIYWSRQPLSGEFLGVALSQSAFILIFSLFVHSLAQAALRLRDAM